LACQARCSPPSSPTEVLGALAVIVGWKTRVSPSFSPAFFPAGRCPSSTTTSADQIQMIMFLRNVRSPGGYLLLVPNGLVR